MLNGVNYFSLLLVVCDPQTISLELRRFFKQFLPVNNYQNERHASDLKLELLCI